LLGAQGKSRKLPAGPRPVSGQNEEAFEEPIVYAQEFCQRAHGRMSAQMIVAIHYSSLGLRWIAGRTDGESLDLLKQKGLASTMGPDHFREE
jgi:hypothetical protein